MTSRQHRTATLHTQTPEAIEMRPRTMLLVEDTLAMRKMLCAFMEKIGFQLDTADEVRAARELLATRQYDIVLMDINLPDGSGFEVVDYVRRELGLRTPIIMLTALGQAATIEHAFARGADDYVTKPLNLTDLRARIDQLLEAI